MSTTGQVQTFSDLITALSNSVRIQTGQTASETICKRLINTALQDIHLGVQYKFPWAERSAVLRTQNDYNTGTVTISQGSTTLTGASTAWGTNNAFGVANMRPGGKIVIAGGTDVYEIASVASDTSAELTQRFVSTSVSAETYSYFEDEYDLHADFLRTVDINFFDTNQQITLVNRREFRQRHVRNDVLGRPTEATIVDRAFSGSATPRRRIIFHRPPDDFCLLPYNFITNKLAVSSLGTEKTQLVDDDDEPNMPLYARHALIYHALYSWYRDLKNDPRTQIAQQEYSSIMMRLTADMEIGAPRAKIEPKIGMYRGAAARPYTQRAGRRYVVGSSFDEMRD